MGGGKGGSQTIGYKYSMSVLMGIGRGPMSELVQINVGEKVAWRGPACNSEGSNISIQAKDLFGGDEKEGGIDGPATILWGDADQVLPGPQNVFGRTLPGVKETISAGNPDVKIPALRGVTCLWYDGEVSSINPYPKEWKMRWRRHIHGWYGGVAWYGAKAIIYMQGTEIVTQKRASQLSPVLQALFALLGGGPKQAVQMRIPGNIKAMNGAHIIYECVTNPEWGRGMSATMLDENSFIYAANQLCIEGFGLCFFWTRQEDVDVFIQTVLDHIGGELYTDRSTGLLTLRLIRNDYDIDDLPTFSPGHGLLEILADDSGSQDIAYNEVVVKYHDPITDTDGEQRAQNVGARIAQGSSNSLSKEYPGLPTPELASRVALRELIVQSSGLKKYKVRLDRSGWRIAPGMPFRVICPQRGIASIVLRAGEVVDSSAQQGGDIQITALEDIFSLPATGLTVPQDGVWAGPVSDPVPPDDSLVFEASYYDVIKHLSQFDIPAVNDADAYFAMLAAQPTATQLLYDLEVETAPGVYALAGTFSFTANATLHAAITPTATAFQIDAPEHWPDDVIKDSMMIGNERMRIDAYDPVTGIITVARGVIDTLPQAHAAGATVWLPDDDMSSDRQVYEEGETVTAAAATRTNSAVLPVEDYVLDSVTIQGRVGRPYPPADLQVDGVSVYAPSGEHAEPVLTWVPRNRIVQADQLVGYFEPAVVAEVGTSWRVDIRDFDGVLLSSHDVPEGTYTFTYDATLQATDGTPSFVRVDVVAIRDTFESLQHHDAAVVITGGYGYGYGLNYGGA